LRKSVHDAGLSSMSEYVIPSMADMKLLASKNPPKFEYAVPDAHEFFRFGEFAGWVITRPE